MDKRELTTEQKKVQKGYAKLFSHQFNGVLFEFIGEIKKIVHSKISLLLLKLRSTLSNINSPQYPANKREKDKEFILKSIDNVEGAVERTDKFIDSILGHGDVLKRLIDSNSHYFSIYKVQSAQATRAIFDLSVDSSLKTDNFSKDFLNDIPLGDYTFKDETGPVSVSQRKFQAAYTKLLADQISFTFMGFVLKYVRFHDLVFSKFAAHYHNVSLTQSSDDIIRSENFRLMSECYKEISFKLNDYIDNTIRKYAFKVRDCIILKHFRYFCQYGIFIENNKGEITSTIPAIDLSPATIVDINNRRFQFVRPIPISPLISSFSPEKTVFYDFFSEYKPEDFPLSPLRSPQTTKPLTSEKEDEILSELLPDFYQHASSHVFHEFPLKHLVKFDDYYDDLESSILDHNPLETNSQDYSSTHPFDSDHSQCELCGAELYSALFPSSKISFYCKPCYEQ